MAVKISTEKVKEMVFVSEELEGFVVDLPFPLDGVEINVPSCFVMVFVPLVVIVGLVLGDFGEVVRVSFTGKLVVEVLLVDEP